MPIIYTYLYKMCIYTNVYKMCIHTHSCGFSTLQVNIMTWNCLIDISISNWLNFICEQLVLIILYKQGRFYSSNDIHHHKQIRPNKPNHGRFSVFLAEGIFIPVMTIHNVLKSSSLRLLHVFPMGVRVELGYKARFARMIWSQIIMIMSPSFSGHRIDDLV